MPKRILHIITKLELGGAQQNTLYTVANLNQSKYVPFLFAGPGGILDAEAQNIKDLDFRTVPRLKRSINPLNDFLAYRQLRKMIRAVKPDVVHTHSSKAGVVGRLAAHAEKVPVIIHSIHGFGIDAIKNPLIQKILVYSERLAAKRTTHFIAVSQQNIETGLRLGLFNKGQVSRIYSGIKLEHFRDNQKQLELKQEFNIPESAQIVGKISCFKEQKNPLAFIELAKLIHEKRPDAYFLLIGDGELRSQIEERIHDLGLSNHVMLPGWRRDIPEILGILNVSVLTSRWEGLPRVIPESLASGIPVVVTKAGGSAEAVEEGITGFIVEQGETQKQAEYVLRILNDPNLAAKMSAAGPDSVSDWDIDSMVLAQEELYDRLLAENC